VLEIEAIYHRNDPIILGVRPSAAARTRWRDIARSCARRCSSTSCKTPRADVTQVWPHEIGASRMLIGIAVKQRYPGHAKQVGVLAQAAGERLRL